MACGPYTSCGAVGPWGFVLETGRPTIPDPTQWLDSAPCAAYFARHAEKSYFPGLDREIEPAWSGSLFSIFDFHRSTLEWHLPRPLVTRVHSRGKKHFLKSDRCHGYSHLLSVYHSGLSPCEEIADMQTSQNLDSLTMMVSLAQTLARWAFRPTHLATSSQLHIRRRPSSRKLSRCSAI